MILDLPYHFETSPDFDGPLQHTYSSSALIDVKSCLRKHFFSKILGIRRGGTSLAPHFGSAIHAGMYAFSRAEGDHNTKVTAGLRAGFSYLGEIEPHKLYTPFKLGEAITLTADNNRNTVYVDTPDGPAVEFKGTAPLNDYVSVSGVLDAMPSISGLTFVKDYKSTSQSLTTWYWQQFYRSSQVSAYLWIANMNFPTRRPAGLIIEGIGLTQGKVEITQKIFHRTPAQLEAWRKYSIRAIDQVHEIATSEDIRDLDVWPENDTACTGCDFAKICAAHAPARPGIIHTMYQPREQKVS